MTVKLLTKQHFEFLPLKGGCTGSSESTLVKIPHCSKSHVTAQLSFIIIQTFCLSFSVYVQTLNRKQNRLTLALIPVECFVVMSDDVEMPSLEEKKFPPLHVIYEDFSDIWVNVSIIQDYS